MPHRRDAPDLQARTFAAYLARIVAKDAVLVSDGRDAYGAFAHAENILHIPIITSRGEHAYKGFHIQNVNAYTSRLKDWMRLFKGVASWYLPSSWLAPCHQRVGGLLADAVFRPRIAALQEALRILYCTVAG